MLDPKSDLNLPVQEPEAINPIELAAPLLKNKWMIALIMAVCVFGSILYNLYATPVYLAKSSIIIRQDVPESVIKQKEATTEKWSNPLSELHTKEKILTSQPLVEELTQRLIEKGHFQGYLKSVHYDRLKPEDQTLVVQTLAGGIQHGIAVSNPKETNILEIRYQDANPILARDLVNLLADIAVEYHQKEQLLVSKNSLLYLNQQLEEARQRVEEAESKLYEYRRKHNIFVADLDKNLIASRRSDLVGKLTEAGESRRALESQKTQLENLLQRKDYLKYTPLTPDNNVLMSLKEQLVATEVNYRKLLIKYGAKHPEVEKSSQEIDILKQKFEQELYGTLTQLQYNLNVVKSREKFLQDSLAETETSAVIDTEKDIEYVVLDRQANSARELYQTLLAAVKEVNINTNTIAENVIYVNEKALISKTPVKPRKALNLMLGWVMGIILGVLFSFGREYLDQTIRNPSDILKAAQLPVLCLVPLYGARKSQNKKRTRPDRILFVAQRPKSLFSESIITLRSQLSIKIPQDSPKIILVTSCAPQEGKSLIASNLAFSLASNGQKTLLLDADLHHPMVHRILEMESPRTGVYEAVVEALNPQWSALDLKKMSLGDIQHLIQLKQWSGTIRINWDSLPAPLSISFQEGRPAGSNLIAWREKFGRGNGSPNPQDITFTLDESEITHFDGQQDSGMQAVEFLRQYPGLSRSTYFAGLLLEKYVQETGHTNFYTLTAGTQPKNPSEILGSEQMKILLKLLKEHFERIIIDAPPAWPLSDVGVLSPLIDWILWICRAGVVPKSLFQHTIHQIRQIQPNIIGVVINAVDVQQSRYYYYGYPSYYYYHRYYQSQYYYQDSVESQELSEANLDQVKGKELH